MTNTVIGFFSSLSAHLLLFIFLTVDFSLPDNKFENFSSIPVKFISLPEENIKKIKSLKISKLKKNKEIIQTKTLIEENIINKLPIELDFLAKKTLDQDLKSIKISNKSNEIQITIGLIQQRINSVWKKPSLINQDIKVEININLAPSGEILNFKLVESSGNKIFDDSALSAISNISFLPEVINLDRRYFERNFRSFNLVFKSIGD
ncbi:MAG: energy transducer TonB [Gammaproteobacteria bacterium]